MNKGMMAATVALLMAAPPSQSWAGGGYGGSVQSGGRPQLDIQVCNRSGRDGLVAVAYKKPNDTLFTNEGWFRVNNGSCRVVATTTNAIFYLYGDTVDGSNRTWRGDTGLCVQYPGPYDYRNNGSATCPNHQEMRRFIRLRATEPGVFTWTMTP